MCWYRHVFSAPSPMPAIQPTNQPAWPFALLLPGFGSSSVHVLLFFILFIHRVQYACNKNTTTSHKKVPIHRHHNGGNEYPPRERKMNEWRSERTKAHQIKTAQEVIQRTSRIVTWNGPNVTGIIDRKPNAKKKNYCLFQMYLYTYGRCIPAHHMHTVCIIPIGSMCSLSLALPLALSHRRLANVMRQHTFGVNKH